MLADESRMEGANNSSAVLLSALTDLMDQIKLLDRSRHRAEKCFAAYAASAMQHFISRHSGQCQHSGSDKWQWSETVSLERKLSAIRALMTEVDGERERAGGVFSTLETQLRGLLKANQSGGDCSTSDESIPGVMGDMPSKMSTKFRGSKSSLKSKNRAPRVAASSPILPHRKPPQLNDRPPMNATFGYNEEEPPQSRIPVPLDVQAPKRPKKRLERNPGVSDDLYDVLKTLENEYDELDRQRQDRIALKEKATSEYYLRRLADEERDIGAKLDKKAEQIERVHKLIEKGPAGIGVGVKHTRQPAAAAALRKNPLLASDTNLNKAGAGPPGHASKQTEKYHNVQLLREMKEFNRFLKNNSNKL